MRLLAGHGVAAWLGFVFGLMAPVIGVFLGLQVSTVLGNILAWPLIALSALTATPFGHFPLWLLVAGHVMSGVVWAFLFALIARLLARRGR